jgi:hypothetical protein
MYLWVCLNLRLFFWILEMFHAGYKCDKLKSSVCRNHNPHSWLISWFVSIVTWRMPLPENMCASPGFVGCVLVNLFCFLCSVLYIISFALTYCIVYSSSKYCIWWHFRHFETFLGDFHVWYKSFMHPTHIMYH